jgi:protein TonB
MTWTEGNPGDRRGTGTGLFPRLLLASLALHAIAVVAWYDQTGVCRKVSIPAPLLVTFPPEPEPGRESTGKASRAAGASKKTAPRAIAAPAPARAASTAASAPPLSIMPELVPAPMGEASALPASPVAAAPAARGGGRESAPGPGFPGKRGEGISVNRGGGNAVPGADGLAGYRALLKRLIEEQKEYPLAARKAGVEGTCKVGFVLSRDGAVREVRILQSCGNGFLDGAASRAVSSVGRFPPFPAGAGKNEESFTVSLAFRLSRR